ncbi:hypothetical protein X975_23546, partial [Stegodyphus mimosarum]
EFSFWGWHYLKLRHPVHSSNINYCWTINFFSCLVLGICFTKSMISL